MQTNKLSPVIPNHTGVRSGRLHDQAVASVGSKMEKFFPRDRTVAASPPKKKRLLDIIDK